MPWRVGQRVLMSSSSWMFSKPKKETAGIIVKVGYFGTYDVRLRHGQVLHGVRRDQLRAQSTKDGLPGCGMSLLTTVGHVAVTVMTAKRFATLKPTCDKRPK